MLAQRYGTSTKVPSLVLGCEKSNPSVHKNYSMLYSSHISWSSPTTPTPLELYPALAFDRLFKDEVQRGDKSVLDAVLGLMLLNFFAAKKQLTWAAAACIAAFAALTFGMQLDAHKMTSGVFRHGELATSRELAREAGAVFERECDVGDRRTISHRVILMGAASASTLRDGAANFATAAT